MGRDIGLGVLCQEIDLTRFLIFPVNIEPEKEGRVEK